MEYLYPNGRIGNGTYTDLKVQSGIPVNSFTLGGAWTVSDEYSTSGKKAVLEYNFQANHVYLVMHKPAASNGTVKVFLDGKPLGSVSAGADVKNGEVVIDSDRLYDLVNMHGNGGQHVLRLEFGPDVQVFAFTFG
jgi:hypothetical protein